MRQSRGAGTGPRLEERTPRPCRLLKARAQSDESPDVRQAAVEELARGWKEDPETLPWLKARARSDENGRAPGRGAGTGPRLERRPETLPILKARAQSDENGAVRQARGAELARGWKDDPETLPILKARAQSIRKAW